MREATDRPLFEVRFRTAEDTTLQVGPIGSQEEAIGVAWQYLGDGRAVRAEVYQRFGDERHLLSVIGQPNPRPPALPAEPGE